MLTPNQNTGVIETVPSGADYIRGVNSPILTNIVNTSGDWRKNEPPGEWQKLMGVTVTQNGFNTNGADFLDCVSFAANDALETYGDFCLPQWPAENVQWLKDNGYFNANGTLNFSDRFTAKMSGTTRDGNSLPVVAQSIHTVGLVPESMWPMPTAQIQADPQNYWDIYYAEIPANVIAKGQEFLKYFKVNYEWLFYPSYNSNAFAAIQADLKVSPIQIATAVCGGWNDATPINGCGAGAQHSTLLTNADNNGYAILDHYVPFEKTLASSYDITYGMSLIMTPIVQASVPSKTATQLKLIAALQKLVSFYKLLIASMK